MKHTYGYLIVMTACIAVLSSCSKDDVEATAPCSPGLELTLETEHFKFCYTKQDERNVEAYADHLKNNYDRIMADFGLTEGAIVKGHFYSNAQTYAAGTDNRYPGSSGFANSSQAFYVIANPLKLSLPLHEFTHNVSNLFYPDSYKTAWLDEGVAIWEAREFPHPKDIPCLANGQFPLIKNLSREGMCSVYQVSYTIIEYVVSKWEFDGVRALIIAEGDPQEALSISSEEFQSQWEMFVQEKYF